MKNLQWTTPREGDQCRINRFLYLVFFHYQFDETKTSYLRWGFDVISTFLVSTATVRANG